MSFYAKFSILFYACIGLKEKCQKYDIAGTNLGSVIIGKTISYESPFSTEFNLDNIE